MRRASLNRCGGFTLMEIIISMVVMGIAAAGIISLQSSIFYGQSDNKNMQVGVQLMQECAEQLLATRRQSGYSTTSSCGGMVLTGYSAPSVTITDPYSSSGCPTGGTCKLVSITQGGLTPITLMLVSY